MTFTTNTLTSKIFGTNNDDRLGVFFYLQWGTTTGANVNATTAESFVGSGDIYITQVQLNAGDIALPFEPKSFADELRACQRYLQKINGYGAYIGNSTVVSSSQCHFCFSLPTSMRIVPTATITGTRGTHWVLRSSSWAANTTGTFTSLGNTAITTMLFIYFASGTFTEGGAYALQLDPGSYILVDAEF